MPWIRITAAAHQAIRANAIGEMAPEGREQPSGDWLIPVSDDVLAALDARRQPMETLSDVIIRIAATRDGKRWN